MGWREVEQAFAEAVEQRSHPRRHADRAPRDDIAFEGAFGFRSLVPERSPMQHGDRFRLVVADQAARHHGGRDDAGARRQAAARRPRHALFSQLRRSRQRPRDLSPSAGALLGTGRVAAVLPTGRARSRRAARSTSWPATAPRNWSTRKSIARSPKRRRPPRRFTPTSTSCCSARRSNGSPGRPLNRFCRDHIFRPLGIRATDFIDISLVRSRRLEPVAEMFAPTAVCPFAQTPAGRRSGRRKRVRDGRRGGTCGTVRAGARGRPYRAGAARLLCGPLRIAAAEDRARFLDAATPRSRIDLGARMGHAVGAVLELGPSFFARRRRPSRLYRHFDLDRARARDRDLAADQPGPSAAR